MKFARIAMTGVEGDEARLAVVQPEEQRVIDLATAWRLRLERKGATREAARRLAGALFPPSMSAAIALGETFIEAAAEASLSPPEEAVQALEKVRWLAPLDPPLIRDFTAFEQHVRNMAARQGGKVFPEFYQRPPYFKINPLAIIAPGAEVPWPHYTRHLDYELEIGLVIGRVGRNVSPEEARRLLFGVTILNDFSARDVQGPEMSSGFGPAKGKDFATALGPWIATCDELDLNGLTMVARVNGEEWSRGSTASLTWKIEELVAYAACGETLWPGELLGSGTVGTGSGAEQGRSLQPGDVVELEVTGLGVLRNRIGQPEPSGWLPEPRQPARR
uniref:2-hydroxyhepta-2,4-diene-1,7-dioate isomerase n=1 Tax=Thermogemmatispora argillosa TaxID=2045280 RepID=A0A455T057_9CHLR|nr:2-hydroxyhepta-2,4-diene-1,7-dioate isomerase [Thermogemmatispora argillosa]